MVTEDLRAFCVDCSQWLHLDKFYLKGGPRYNEQLGEYTKWHGAPWPYCITCYKARQKRARQKYREDVEQAGRWNAYNNDVPVPHLSANYPPVSQIRDVLISDYDMDPKTAKELTTNDLFTLWDKILEAKANAVESQD
jgi:hypothetical protein